MRPERNPLTTFEGSHLKAPLDGAAAPQQQDGGFTPGVDHVALKADDIHATYAALCTRGVAFDQEPRYMAHSDRTIAIFHDPDGNCFHLTT
jgi:4-hydroxyphenylpyruvate dioxygenase-like putative hemolysin